MKCFVLHMLRPTGEAAMGSSLGRPRSKHGSKSMYLIYFLLFLILRFRLVWDFDWLNRVRNLQLGHTKVPILLVIRIWMLIGCPSKIIDTVIWMTLLYVSFFLKSIGLQPCVRSLLPRSCVPGNGPWRITLHYWRWYILKGPANWHSSVLFDGNWTHWRPFIEGDFPLRRMPVKHSYFWT